MKVRKMKKRNMRQERVYDFTEGKLVVTATRYRKTVNDKVLMEKIAYLHLTVYEKTEPHITLCLDDYIIGVFGERKSWPKIEKELIGRMRRLPKKYVVVDATVVNNAIQAIVQKWDNGLKWSEISDPQTHFFPHLEKSTISSEKDQNESQKTSQD